MSQPLYAIPGDVVDIETILESRCPHGCLSEEGTPAVADVRVNAVWNHGGLKEPARDGYGQWTTDCIIITWELDCDCERGLDGIDAPEIDRDVRDWLDQVCQLIPASDVS